VLAADILHSEAQYRKRELEFSGYTDERITASAIDRIKRGDQTAKLVVANTASTAASVIQIFLKKRYAQLTQDTKEDIAQAADDIAEDPSVAEALQGDDLKQLGVGTVALRCAALRQDEFILGAREYIDVTPEGRALFNRALATPSRELVPPEVIVRKHGSKTVVLHNKRLRCPAIFVEGLIPMMTDIMSDTIVEAQSQVNEQLKWRSGYPY
jgi:hypothetical protein